MIIDDDVVRYARRLEHEIDYQRRVLESRGDRGLPVGNTVRVLELYAWLRKLLGRVYPGLDQRVREQP